MRACVAQRGKRLTCQASAASLLRREARVPSFRKWTETIVPASEWTRSLRYQVISTPVMIESEKLVSTSLSGSGGGGINDSSKSATAGLRLALLSGISGKRGRNT